MSEKLDRQGIDIQVVYPEKTTNIQVKKLSLSREVRQPKLSSGKEIILTLEYEVLPHSGKFKQDGQIRLPHQRWQDKWHNKLKALDNDFVIFLPTYIEEVLAQIVA